MNLKVTFLGTGTSQGVPVIGCPCDTCASSDARDKRLRCSVHIQADDTSFVIDTGPDFRYQMLRAGITTLDAILITHEHNDHVIGLDDIRAYNYLQRKDMPLFATARVIAELKQRFSYVFGNSNYPGTPKVLTNEIKPNEAFTFNDIVIQPIQVMHGRLPVIGYRIGDFTYITDASDIDDQALELIKGSRVFVLNALRFEEHHSHFTVKEATEIVKKLGIKETYLTHISHRMGRVAEWEKKLPEGIFSAIDGLSLTIEST